MKGPLRCHKPSPGEALTGGPAAAATAAAGEEHGGGASGASARASARATYARFRANGARDVSEAGAGHWGAYVPAPRGGAERVGACGGGAGGVWECENPGDLLEFEGDCGTDDIAGADALDCLDAVAEFPDNFGNVVNCVPSDLPKGFADKRVF